MVIGRNAARSLYRADIVTFEDDRGSYDQRDAGGFIRLNALRLRTTAVAYRGSTAK
jgi:argininosuccinate synthase